LNQMTKQIQRRRNTSLATINALMWASGETIARRTLMMAQGTCSAAEYQRMVTEKVVATQKSMLALMTGGSSMSLIAPYLRSATANAKRLRTPR
jgi:hypothetical protein